MGYVKEMKEEDFGWVVGRPINGITLNPQEHLLDDEGKEKTFRFKDDAVEFLKNNGVTDDEINEMKFFIHTQCLHCGEILYIPEEDICKDEDGLYAKCPSCHEGTFDLLPWA